MRIQKNLSKWVIFEMPTCCARRVDQHAGEVDGLVLHPPGQDVVVHRLPYLEQLSPGDGALPRLPLPLHHSPDPLGVPDLVQLLRVLDDQDVGPAVGDLVGQGLRAGGSVEATRQPPGQHGGNVGDVPLRGVVT